MNQKAIRTGLVFTVLVYALAMAAIALACSGCTITRIKDGELVEEKISVPVVGEVVEAVEESDVVEAIEDAIDTPIEDVAGAVVDAIPEVVEAVPEIIKDSKDGDWGGVVLGVGGALAAIWAGLVARKRIRRRKVRTTL